MIRVLSSMPVRSSVAIMRPISWSTWFIWAAKASIWRAYIFLCSGASESHAGMSAGRGASLVLAGTMPLTIWFFRIVSRATSQPMSNAPLYLSRKAWGAWCGACIAPGAHCIMNGRSGATDFCAVIQ